jgi:RHS repeat-associated protein
MQRNTTITNALGKVTIFNYCTCGALASTLDAATNLTQFYYDNQGNVTNTVYADGYSTFKTYNLLQQMVTVSDSAGTSATNTYNNQGLLVAVSNAVGRVQTMACDVLDRVTNSVDANGVSINTAYDNLNRPLTRTYPDNGVEKWGYTLNVPSHTSYTNQIDNVTLYAYDALGRKTSEVAVGVTTNQFAYDAGGELLTLTDGRNQTTTWHYDMFGRVTNKVDAAGVVDFVYQYDADNHLTNRWTPAKGNTTYAYDAVGNRTNINYGGMNFISFAYDALNRMTNMVDGVGTNHFGYDAAGEVLSAGGLWDNDTVTYAYNNRRRGSLSVGSWNQTYGYDNIRRLTSIISPAGEFDYTLGGASSASPLIKKVSLPNGAYITNSYDNVSRLQSTALANSLDHVLDGYTYTDNQLGQRTNIVRNYGLMNSSASAGYDAIGQLTSWTAKESNGVARLNEQLGYAYDAAGNLIQRTNNTLIQTFNVDAVNELTNITRAGTLTVSGNTPMPANSVTVNGQPALTYADFTFASGNGFTLANGQNSFTNIAMNYNGTATVTNTITANLPAAVTMQLDANGNLTNDGTRSFNYDVENQLTNVMVAGQWQRSFIYDGMNRRRIARDYIWQGSAWALTNETRFIYDGNLVIQERDGNNVAQVSYTRGIGGLLALTQHSTPNPQHFYYHADGNRNITGLMDANQYMVARYLYDPFGKLLGKWGPMADVNAYRFAGKEYDSKAGLYYFGRRFYDPNLQRWLNRDPIQERGGLNIYAYCGNNPVSLIDILGFCPTWLDNLLSALDATADDIGAYVFDNGGLFANTLNDIGNGLNNYADSSDNSFLGPLAAYEGSLFNTSANMVNFDTWISPFDNLANGVNTETGQPLNGWDYSQNIGQAGLELLPFLAPALSSLAADGGVWNLSPFARGQSIEQTLGANLPGNFPVIDQFANGTATSIKSIDLGAASYQNTSALASRLNGYVDSVSGFNGANWAGVNIDASQITARQLQLAIQPGSASAAQQAVINAAAARAQGMGVNFIVTPVP